jgi:hypothetical protein
VRVTTAFNRILGVPGANVVSVTFTGDGVVVGIRARGRRLVCPCGRSTRARYDTSRRRWRHVDMGATKVWLEADIARLDCRGCSRVTTQQVAWARPRARHSRDFEDVVVWLVQRTDMTTVAALMRCSWAAVHAMAARVVAERIDAGRLEGLYRIGVDEISYRRGHQYLTIVADHDQAKVVWVAKGKRGAALEGFFDALGPERCASLQAISMDLGTIYRDAARRRIPEATICFDPFHVIQIANRALDAVYKSTGRDSASRGRGPGLAGDPGGVAVGGGASQRRPARHAQSVAPGPISAVAGLGTQRGLARPVPADPDRPGPGLSQTVDQLRGPQPYPRLCQPGPPGPPELRADHRRGRAGSVQRPPGRHQQPHPAHPTTRLRLPQHRLAVRHDLPLHRRHHLATPGPLTQHRPCVSPGSDAPASLPYSRLATPRSRGQGRPEGPSRRDAQRSGAALTPAEGCGTEQPATRRYPITPSREAPTSTLGGATYVRPPVNDATLRAEAKDGPVRVRPAPPSLADHGQGAFPFENLNPDPPMNRACWY